MSNNTNLDFLPDPGEGRKWVIDLNPKSRTKPLVIKLYERFRRGARGSSTLLNSEYVVADRKAIENAAQDILERVGNYDLFVGTMDRENPNKE